MAIRASVDHTRLSLVQVHGPDGCDRLLAELPSPSWWSTPPAWASAPGSPVTNRARFGAATLAWELNYRGALTFLHQAAACGAATVDGWDYFIAGWAGGLTAIACAPFSGDLLARFARAAAPYRPRP